MNINVVKPVQNVESNGPINATTNLVKNLTNSLMVFVEGDHMMILKIIYLFLSLLALQIFLTFLISIVALIGFILFIVIALAIVFIWSALFNNGVVPEGVIGHEFRLFGEKN